MGVATKVRVLAAVAYVGLTVVLFDAVASLSRPAANGRDVQLAAQQAALAKAETPARR